MKILSNSPTLVAEIPIDSASDGYTITDWGCCDNDKEALDTAVDLAYRRLPLRERTRKKLLRTIKRDLNKSGMFQYGHKDDSRQFSVLILKPYAPRI